MRKPILFAVALLLLICAMTNADCKHDKETLSALHKLAQDKDASISVRIGAIKLLGDCKPADDLDTKMFLKDIYKDLLTKPAGEEYTFNLLFYYVAQALGQGILVGDDAQDLLKILIQRRGRDRILDTAIDKASEAITKGTKGAQAVSPAANPAQDKQKQTDSKPTDHIDTLILIVQDDGADINMLIIAARELGILGKDKKLNKGQQTAAENALKGLLKKKVAQGDEALKCVVEKALAQVDP